MFDLLFDLLHNYNECTQQLGRHLLNLVPKSLDVQVFLANVQALIGPRAWA